MLHTTRSNIHLNTETTRVGGEYLVAFQSWSATLAPLALCTGERTLPLMGGQSQPQTHCHCHRTAPYRLSFITRFALQVRTNDSISIRNYVKTPINGIALYVWDDLPLRRLDPEVRPGLPHPETKEEKPARKSLSSHWLPRIPPRCPRGEVKDER